MDERTKIMIEDLQKRLEFLENFLLKRPVFDLEEFLKYVQYVKGDLIYHQISVMADDFKTFKSGEYK